MSVPPSSAQRSTAPSQFESALISDWLEFLEFAPRWSLYEIEAWLQRVVVERGWLDQVASVQEGDAFPGLRLPTPDSATGVFAEPGPAYEASLQGLLVAARGAVVDALSGWVEQPQDDRFLAAAIYQQKVSRSAQGWEPKLSTTDSLSQWILSMIAVSILEDRARFDAHLSVCEVCGRAQLLDRQLAHNPAEKARCGDHPLRRMAVPASSDASRKWSRAA